MRNLLLTSFFLIVLLIGCVSVKPKKIRPSGEFPGREQIFPDFQGTTLYRATLNIKKHRMTGLLLVKHIDSISPGYKSTPIFRIIFTNEVGITFFDFELKKDSMHLISCFESFNKKPFINILKTDFRALTSIEDFNPQKIFRQDSTNYLVVFGETKSMKIWKIYSPSADTLYNISAKSNFADPVFITLSQYSSGSPAKIVLTNPFVGLKLSLRKLK
jgi:hypothetical protein